MFPLTLIPLEVPNPFDGVTPSLGPFEDSLKQPVAQLMGVVWFACLVVAAITFITALTSARRAADAGRPHAKEDAMVKVGWSGAILAALAMAPVIVGVFLSFGN